MIRFFFRLLSALTLAAAVVMAVLDATRSVAASRLVTTPLGESWAGTFPQSLETLKQFLEGNAAWLWDPVAVAILQLPGFVVFAALAFLLYAIGHRPASARNEWA